MVNDIKTRTRFFIVKLLMVVIPTGKPLNIFG